MGWFAVVVFGFQSSQFALQLWNGFYAKRLVSRFFFRAERFVVLPGDVRSS